MKTHIGVVFTITGRPDLVYVWQPILPKPLVPICDRDDPAYHDPFTLEHSIRLGKEWYRDYIGTIGGGTGGYAKVLHDPQECYRLGREYLALCQGIEIRHMSSTSHE